MRQCNLALIRLEPSLIFVLVVLDKSKLVGGFILEKEVNMRNKCFGSVAGERVKFCVVCLGESCGGEDVLEALGKVGVRTWL